MGTISLQIPQVGQPDTTEDVKIANDFTTIQTVINGNLNDANLLSPNSSVRNLLLTSQAPAGGGAVAGDYFFLPEGTGFVSSGTSGTTAIACWQGDAGYSGQPQDFTVANKSAYCRIRMSVQTNATAPAVTFVASLYPLTGIVGGAGTITYTFGAALAGGASVASPGASSAVGATGAQFAMPTANTAYTLGVNISGTTAANSFTAITAQLYAYNA
jgi:hypothetical protein